MLPFDELQRFVNESYYRKRGRKLYSDFKTFGSSDKIAQANALEFYHWLKKNFDGSEIKIYDFGIGNGLFSRYFLEEIYLLDKCREFVPRISYFICDISEELVKNAEKEMQKYSVHGIVCNALADLKFLKGAAYVRSNEMYDDLPAKIFLREGDNLFEVLANERMRKEYCLVRNKEIKQLMKKMPEGYEIPINFGAGKHLTNCVKQLRKNGYMDIFDYGFSSLDEIRSLPAEIWNNSIVREFNSQLTIDVNFIYLSGLVKNCSAQPQKSYAEKILNQKLYYAELEQLYYFNEGEVKKNIKKMGNFGYPKDFLSSGVSEFDDYIHFRVIK